MARIRLHFTALAMRQSVIMAISLALAIALAVAAASAIAVSSQPECFEAIEDNAVVSGAWSADCVSEKPALKGSGDRYARYYTFTLQSPAQASITLTSEVDAYLYLLHEHGANGDVAHHNDDISYPENTNSEISELLQPGDYTIEATTYLPQTDGEFTLEASGIAGALVLSASAGANHVCALSAAGAVQCWGLDDEGQVSDRPQKGGGVHGNKLRAAT